MVWTGLVVAIIQGVVSVIQALSTPSSSQKSQGALEAFTQEEYNKRKKKLESLRLPTSS